MNSYGNITEEQKKKDLNTKTKRFKTCVRLIMTYSVKTKEEKTKQLLRKKRGKRIMDKVKQI